MAYGYASHNVKKCPGNFKKDGCEGKGRPVPGHVYCAKCERSNEAASAKKATDSSKRARMHRALDAVMDRRAAKDAGQGAKEDVVCTHCGRPIRPSLVNPGKYTHLSEADTKVCGHPAKP